MVYSDSDIVREHGRSYENARHYSTSLFRYRRCYSVDVMKNNLPAIKMTIDKMLFDI